jgi:hypothetical protein
VTRTGAAGVLNREIRMRHRLLSLLRSVILTLSICSPLGAQTVGVGYQLARSDQNDMLESGGPGLRVRFKAPVDLRYDYLTSEIERFENPCGGFAPPSCGPDSLATSTHLHSVFIAARARLVSLGAFHLFALPEAGFVTGKIVKRTVATGQEFTSYTGGALGVGIALELSAARLGGTPVGGWIAARIRHFTPSGPAPADTVRPWYWLDWIRSVEVGLTVALAPRVLR